MPRGYRPFLNGSWESALPDGEILVVGSGQTGVQVAEELHLAGRGRDPPQPPAVRHIGGSMLRRPRMPDRSAPEGASPRDGPRYV